MGEQNTVKRRKFRIWWPFAGLGALISLIVIVIAGGYLWLRGSLPEMDGEFPLAGLLLPRNDDCRMTLL